MKSPIEQWRLGYDPRSGERVQITEGAFDELVISAAGIHIDVQADGTDPRTEGWAALVVHVGTLCLSVRVHADGLRIINALSGTFVDGVLVEEA